MISQMIDVVCREIESRIILNQNEAAAKYANILRLAAFYSEDANVEDLNAAIVKRWSRSGLDHIKKLAWDIFEGKP